MRLTMKAGNNSYVDIDVDFSQRVLTFISPIPNIDVSVLMDLSDAYSFTFELPITETFIRPDTKPNITDDMHCSLVDNLHLLLTLANVIITDK